LGNRYDHLSLGLAKRTLHFHQSPPFSFNF
jgi:hypothetical protein